MAGGGPRGPGGYSTKLHGFLEYYTAYAFSFVVRLAQIARREPRRTLCRSSELPGGRAYTSRDSRKSWPLSFGSETVHIVFSLEACEGPNACPRAKLQRVSSEDRRTPVRGQAVEQSAEMRSALEFFATGQSFREGCQAYTFADRARLGFTAHTQGAFSQRRCGESPRVKLQRVSSEDCRTPVRGQAVKQSAEMVCLACSQRRCGESPRAKLQRLSSEDCEVGIYRSFPAILAGLQKSRPCASITGEEK